jgi:hypothetical protein
VVIKLGVDVGREASGHWPHFACRNRVRTGAGVKEVPLFRADGSGTLPGIGADRLDVIG